MYVWRGTIHTRQSTYQRHPLCVHTLSYAHALTTPIDPGYSQSYWCLEMFTTLGTMLWGDARTTLTDEGRGPYAMFSLSNMDNLCNAYDLFNRLENNVTASTGDGTGAGQGSGEVLLAADAVPTLFQRSYALNAFGLAGVAAVVVGLVLHRRGQGKPAYRAIATEAAVTSDGFGDGGMW